MKMLIRSEEGEISWSILVGEGQVGIAFGLMFRMGVQLVFLLYGCRDEF